MDGDHKMPFVGVSQPRSWSRCPVLSTFGENRPRFLNNLSKLTFEYPHEGPCVENLQERPDKVSRRHAYVLQNLI